MSTLKYFTQPKILQPIGCRRLFKLLSPFSAQLLAAKFPMPPSDDPAPDECFRPIASAFALTDSLPPALLDLLLTLESAASPENNLRLEQTIQRRIPNVALGACGPLDRALEIWFAVPDELPQFAPPHSDVAPSIQPSKNPSIQSEPAAPRSDAFSRLARLSPVEYDQVRRAEAKRLGLRLRTLDDAVESAALLLADAEANQFSLAKIDPWPEPITDALALFEEVHSRILLYMYLPPGAAVALTLWSPHAHALSAFSRTPRLNFTSTEPGSGKTTCIELLSTLCPNFMSTNSLKPAVLYRILHKGQATVALDELDLYLKAQPELHSLLNAGNNPTACVHRCEGKGVRVFKVFGPIILSGLGHLPRTLHDRSIVIHFTKAPSGTLGARFQLDHADTERILGRKLARWARDNFDRLAACEPVMPPAAFNRLGDNWRPLFALAQIIGGPWPGRVLDSFTALSRHSQAQAELSAANLQPSTFNLQLLLADLRLIFTQSGATRLFSSTLVESLRALPDRPWSNPAQSASSSTIHHQSSLILTPARLSRKLRPFGARSRTLRINGVKAKGYDLADFADAFAKHLPPNGPNPH